MCTRRRSRTPTSARRLQPTWAKGTRRGAAKFHLGDLQAAKLAYSKAWDLEPTNAQTKADLEHVLSEIAGMRELVAARQASWRRREGAPKTGGWGPGRGVRVVEVTGPPPPRGCPRDHAHTGSPAERARAQNFHSLSARAVLHVRAHTLLDASRLSPTTSCTARRLSSSPRCARTSHSPPCISSTRSGVHVVERHWSRSPGGRGRSRASGDRGCGCPTTGALEVGERLGVLHLVVDAAEAGALDGWRCTRRRRARARRQTPRAAHLAVVRRR